MPNWGEVGRGRGKNKTKNGKRKRNRMNWGAHWLTGMESKKKMKKGKKKTETGGRINITKRFINGG